jgi:predicted RNA-binding Zn-ribbon protein involved in translation (DUF1610 family)
VTYNVYGDRVDQFTGRPVDTSTRKAHQPARCPECGGMVVTSTIPGPVGERYVRGRCVDCGRVDEPEWTDS